MRRIQNLMEQWLFIGPDLVGAFCDVSGVPL